MIIVRPPTQSDIKAVAANMRPMDALECRVVGGCEPLEALREGVAESIWSYAVEVDDTVICVFGIASDGLMGENGCPWLLAVNGFERHARTILTISKSHLIRMREEFETLANWVHAHNRNAIRYLKFLGFEFGEETIINGEPFLPFSMICKDEMRQAA